MGAEVTLSTTNPNKAEDTKRLAADRVVISKDEAAMASERVSLSLTFRTSASHSQSLGESI
jgi:uncharacterized zinc-type alcohol dehydrogenase-like protein